MSGARLTEWAGGNALATGGAGGARWSRFCGPKARAAMVSYMLPASGGYGRRSLRIVYPARLVEATINALRWGAQ